MPSATCRDCVLPVWELLYWSPYRRPNRIVEATMLPDSRVFRLAFGLLALGFLTMEGRSAERPNVLLICVDDLRPELGCYGADHIHSPAIDRLASEGRRFTRHYVQSAVCGPSRCSLLTGQRYWHWDCWSRLRKAGEEPEQPVSLAHHFRRHGYQTISIGKISHEPGGTMPPAYTIHQVPFSWDRAFCPPGHWKKRVAGFLRLRPRPCLQQGNSLDERRTAAAAVRVR